MDDKRFKRKTFIQSSEGANVCEEKSWLIVELDEKELIEESSNDESDESESSDQFNQFSVSTTPEKWVHLRNKILCCFWPKTHPGKKIKSCEGPKETRDENWSVHRCRILMNGVKFKSYKEAKEAEKIAEQCSTISEFKARYGRKRRNDNNKTILTNKIIKKSSDFEVVDDGALESTMDFDVESVSESISSSEEDDSFLIVGNDSFGYNEFVKYGYFKNNAIRPNEDVDRYNSSSDTDDNNDNNGNGNNGYKDETLSVDIIDGENICSVTYPVQKGHEIDECTNNSLNDENLSDGGGYNHFKLNSDECFTSTLLEDRTPLNNADVEKEIEHGTLKSNANPGTNANYCAQQNILSRIEKVEVMVSEFNRSMQQELHELKECAKLSSTNTSSVPILNVHDSEAISSESGEKATTASSKIEILNIEVLNAPIHPGKFIMKSDVRSQKSSVSSEFNRSMDLKECAKLSATNTSSVPILNVHDSEAISSESGEKATTASSKIEILNIELLNAPIHPVEKSVSTPSLIEIPKVDFLTAPDLNEIPNTVAEDTYLVPVIELPLNDDNYKKLEDLVEEKSLEGKSFEVEEESAADALFKCLLPFAGEIETKYMDRVVDLLFEEEFFLEMITWEKAKNSKRFVITNSNILKCWMKSYETQFSPDNKDNFKFKAHCRRIKSKKRAAIKAKQIAKIKAGANARANAKKAT